MIRGNILGACCIALALAAGAACGKKGGGAAGAKPKVAVSIFPLYDLTRRVAGDRLDVMLVLPPGKSEHAYDPTPKEIARLEGTQLGIAVGHDMDAWVEAIMKSAASSARIVRVGEKVPTVPIDVEPIGEGEGEEHHEGEHHDDHDKDEKKPDKHDDHDKHGDHDEHDKPGSGTGTGTGSAAVAHEEAHHEHATVGSPDPHVWMDPDRMVAAVDAIAAELSTLDPAGKDTYTKNAEAVKGSLRTLDGAISARAKAWTKRTIVTFHGSMAYYAKRYNLRIAAVVEPLAGKEPTAAYIAEVLAAIKRGQAVALFSEPQLDRAPAEMIAREAKIALGELDPVGGVPGRDTYEALLTWNTDQLEKVLK